MRNNLQLTAARFVAVVAAIVVVIAFQFRVDALLPVLAAKLVQRADDALRAERAHLFVLLVTAVVVAVALLIYRYTQRIDFRFVAWKIAFMARSVRWNTR